jgi:hypothetical protein
VHPAPNLSGFVAVKNAWEKAVEKTMSKLTILKKMNAAMKTLRTIQFAKAALFN